MIDTYYHPLVFFVLGACLGSFLNVVFYRYPLGKSVVYPGSACPRCGRAIAFYDNIPILSWWLLRGKCRHCKAPFSARYWLLELCFATIAALPAALVHPGDWRRGAVLAGVLLTWVPAIYLLGRYRRAPWYLTVTGGALGLFYAFQVLGV